MFDKEFISKTHDNDGGDSFFENWLHHRNNQECYDGGMRYAKRKKAKLVVYMAFVLLFLYTPKEWAQKVFKIDESLKM